MPESLQAKLAAARLRWRGLKALRGAASQSILLVVLILASFYSDRILVYGTVERAAWLVALLFAWIGGSLLLVARPSRLPIPDESLALQVEQRFPALQERLLSTVELAHAGAAAGVSRQMVASLAIETERLARPLDFSLAIPTRPARRQLGFASIAILVLLTHIILAPAALWTWAKRIMNPGADIPVFARTLVWVVPEAEVVPAGEEVRIAVRTTGRHADHATLRYRIGGAAWSTTELTKPNIESGASGPAERFDFRIPDARQDVTCYATSNDGRANIHTIRVEERPAVLSVRTTLHFPDYMRRAPETVVATSGNIVAPVGTRADIEVKASKPLSEAAIVEAHKPSSPLQVSNEVVRGALVVRKDESYGLRIKDRNGFEPSYPPEYSVRALIDRSPEVQVVKPGGDVDRSPRGVVNLRVSARDDYGVESLRLDYHIAKRTGSHPLPGGGGATPVETGGTWGLASLHLKPGDTIVYEAVARDTDNVSGPHAGRSAAYRINILSETEIRERIEAARAQEREALRALLERQKEAQAALERARRTASKPDKLAQAESSQRAVAQDATELAKQMAQTTEQMRDNLLGSAADLEHRRANQSTIQRLAQKEMPAAANAIQKAAQPQSTRSQELSSAAQQEQRIRDELERLNQENSPAQEIGKLAQEADRLSREQQRLADQSDLAAAMSENRTPAQEKQRLDDLAHQQAGLKAQTQALQQQLQKAAQEATANGQKTAPDLNAAAKQIPQNGTTQKQAAAQQSLQASKPSDASPNQNKAAQDLRDLAKSLDQAGKKQAAEDLAARADALEKAADRLQEMSNEQARIARNTVGNPSADASQKLAAKQQDLVKQAEAVKPQLQGAAAAQQSLNQAQRNMQTSQQELSKNSPSSATSPAQQATRQLLQAAQAAREAAQAAREQKEARELAGKVRQLAQEQRKTLGQTRKVDTQRNANPTNPSLEKQAQDLGKQQTGLLEKGRGLTEETDNNAFRWALSEANRKMDNAARALQQQNTGKDTQRHQENAAQTLERIARALDRQAEGQEQSQSDDNQSSQGQQMAQAQGDLELAREMEAQLRQETGNLDRRRDRNPKKNLSAEQQREANALQQAQRQTRSITNRAAQQIRSAPDVQKGLQRAMDEMADVEDMLQKEQTGDPTQSTQDKIVGRLDQAIRQTQQAMREQQQMAQAQGQKQQNNGQLKPQNQPAQRSFAPLAKVQNGPLNDANMRGRGFGALGARDQQSLRQGSQEKIPAEFRELVKQYYKALSERANR